MFAPAFAAASGEHPDITFGKAGAGDQTALAGAAQITSVPTLTCLGPFVPCGCGRGGGRCGDSSR
jgi:hypothetical protein